MCNKFVFRKPDIDDDEEVDGDVFDQITGRHKVGWTRSSLSYETLIIRLIITNFSAKQIRRLD